MVLFIPLKSTIVKTFSRLIIFGFFARFIMILSFFSFAVVDHIFSIKIDS